MCVSFIEDLDLLQICLVNFDSLDPTSYSQSLLNLVLYSKHVDFIFYRVILISAIFESLCSLSDSHLEQIICSFILEYELIFLGLCLQGSLRVLALKRILPEICVLFCWIHYQSTSNFSFFFSLSHTDSMNSGLRRVQV